MAIEIIERTKCRPDHFLPHKNRVGTNRLCFYRYNPSHDSQDMNQPYNISYKMKLQNYKITKLQNYRITKLQITKLQNYRITK